MLKFFYAEQYGGMGPFSDADLELFSVEMYCSGYVDETPEYVGGEMFFESGELFGKAVV